MRAWREILTLASAIVPAWFVWNPGGSGGSGTVHTDGITIQGDGSLATPIALLDAITDGVSLAGAGIAANKLRIVPLTFFTFGSSDSFQGTDHNFIYSVGFYTATPVVFSNLTVGVAGFDPSPETVDMGLYDFAGNRVCHTGSFSLTTGGIQTFPILGAPITIENGLYLLAFSNSSDGFAIYGGTEQYAWVSSPFLHAAPTPGLLPATVTPHAITPTLLNIGFCLS